MSRWFQFGMANAADPAFAGWHDPARRSPAPHPYGPKPEFGLDVFYSDAVPTELAGILGDMVYYKYFGPMGLKRVLGEPLVTEVPFRLNFPNSRCPR
jgi:hypothetical protein